MWVKRALRALSFGVFKTWDNLVHLLPGVCTRSQVAKTTSVVFGQAQHFIPKQINTV